MDIKFSINAGKLKHLKLKYNSSEGTRPTKSIVRESCFNTIGSDIAGSVFIEAFGGCGSMGIEALSRGADFAVFYENNKYAYDILCQNLFLAKKRESTLRFHTFYANFFSQSLDKYIASSQRKSILYLDPPFCIRNGNSDIYQKCITKIQNLERYTLSLIIFEHWSEYNMPSIIGAYALLKVRQFGKSTLTYYVVKD